MKLILKYILEAIHSFKSYFITVIGIAVIMTTLDALMPWGIKCYLNLVTKKNDYTVLLVGLIFFGVYHAISMSIKTAWYIALDKFGGKYIEKLTVDLQQKMVRVPYSQIEQVQPSIIRNILYLDVLNIFRVIGHHLPSLMNSLSVILVALALSFFYQRKVTLLISVSIAIGVGLSWLSRNILARTAGETNQKLKTHDSWCSQFIQMLPVIQTHNIQEYFQRKSSENIQQFIHTSIQEDKRSLFWAGLVNSYHSLFSVALSALLAMPLSGNSVVGLVFFTMITNLVMNHAQQSELLFQQIARNYVSFQNVEELFQLPERQGKKKINVIDSIEFHNVDFAYVSGVNVLEQINCQLKKGEVIYLRGANGSGKSTFIKLITGLYEPTAGELLFNGIRADTYSQESRNQAILYIGQDEKCLNESFKRYLKVITGQDFSKEKYEELIKNVGLDDEGRDITENGLSLSAGQRKKLLFLQMILRWSTVSVIIMDELTAGLDAATTQKVNEFIAQIAEKKELMIFIIDHALSEQIPITKVMDFQNGHLIS